MTVLEHLKETQTNTQAKQQPETPARMAAVVEAAYILEAVRK